MAHAVLPTDDKLLSAAECAERVGCHASDWWGRAKQSARLRRGCVRSPRRTRWLLSAVIEHMHYERRDTR